jgi:hypothetical protein
LALAVPFQVARRRLQPVRETGRNGSSRLVALLIAVLGIRPPLRGNETKGFESSSLTWCCCLAVNASAALVLAAIAANASRLGYDWASRLFYFSIAMLFMPVAIRLTLPHLSRSERIADLMIVALGLFALRVIRAPIYFIGHDEYLHWVTAQHIMETGRLFTPSVLFPVGPSFPGLEIITAAIAQLSGVSIFVAAIPVLAAARIVFVGALFLVYERMTGSARIAALGCIFYMGASTFVFFDTYFSYESLALALLALALLLDHIIADSRVRVPAGLLLIFGLVALGLAMTHHVTAYAVVGILAGIVMLEALSRGPRHIPLWLLIVAACALAIPLGWSNAMGNPVGGYLGPVFENAIKETSDFFHSAPASRQLFTGDDGTVAPLWERVTMVGSVALICAGLSLGFFRSLAWAGARAAQHFPPRAWSDFVTWDSSRLILFVLMTLLYPISIVFRLSRSGWEIGNRIGPFAFLGVGVVLSICVVTLLQGQSRSGWRATFVGLVATVIMIGGIISSEGPRILVPARYQVSADGASIEPMGVEAALWTKEWLGPGSHFLADRVNQLLLSGFGGQLVSTTLGQGYDAAVVLVSDHFSPADEEVLRKLGLDYLLVDLRLSTGLPVVGSYFDGGLADKMLVTPPKPAAMLKFNSVPGASRIFDNGYAVIFDVRTLSGRL